MQITIQIIPHEAQRYKTPGDWTFDEKGDLTIKISKLSDERFEALIAVHELIEVLLCKQAGITQAEVDAYDMDFEENRKEGDLSEPGDKPSAPYFKQHGIASGVERMLAAELGVDWEKYASEVEKL